jgi:hypothetical protein
VIFLILVIFMDKKMQRGVIRFVVQAESPGVVQKYTEFVGEPAEKVKDKKRKRYEY